MSTGGAIQPDLVLEELFGHLGQLLGPPRESWFQGPHRPRPAMSGFVGGRRATLRLEPVIVDFNDDGTSWLVLEMEGATYGIVCSMSAPAVLSRSGAPTGDAEFDAIYDMFGAPRAVLTAIFDAELRWRMKAYPSSVRFEANRVVLSLGPRPRTVESVAAQLAIAASILERIPGAIRAAGAEAYLVTGTLASHPEVVAIRERERSIRTVLVAVAVVMGLFSLGGIAAVLILVLLLS